MHLVRGDCLEVSTAVFLLAAAWQADQGVRTPEALAPVQARFSGRMITLG